MYKVDKCSDIVKEQEKQAYEIDSLCVTLVISMLLAWFVFQVLKFLQGHISVPVWEYSGLFRYYRRCPQVIFLGVLTERAMTLPVRFAIAIVSCEAAYV